MSLKPTRRAIGRQVATPPSRRKAPATPGRGGLPSSPQPLSLAKQHSDFTAEGSPPPGKVATNSPACSTEPDPPGP